jgi:pyruvate dehydrogenase E2 component (dihydrolipoamide acetyltransferase)
MPALELAQETGKVVAWRKLEGEHVKKGELLLDIETDKAVVEVESPGEGVLAGITAKIGDDIAVGKTIAWLLGPGESVPAAESQIQTGRTGGSAAAKSGPSAVAAPASQAAASARLGVAPLISPKARRLASEKGVDLSTVAGTGPGGEVLVADIERALGTRPNVGASEYETTGTVWRLMTERVVQSWTTVPQFFLTREADGSALVKARDAVKESGVSYTDFLVALVGRALAKHPRVNASWTPQGIKRNDEINVAVAVATDDGVSVAVIRNAARLDVNAVATERQALAERARAGKSRPSDVSGGTFTISNLGMRRVDAFTAIINPPQAAILAVGSIIDRVVAVDGRPAVRPMLTMTLSSDHRVIDGARAAAFMDDLAAAIGDPGTWLT